MITNTMTHAKPRLRDLTPWRTIRICKRICHQYGYRGEWDERLQRPTGTLQEQHDIAILAVMVGEEVGHRQHRELIIKIVRAIVLNSEADG